MALFVERREYENKGLSYILSCDNLVHGVFKELRNVRDLFTIWASGYDSGILKSKPLYDNTLSQKDISSLEAIRRYYLTESKNEKGSRILV